MSGSIDLTKFSMLRRVPDIELGQVPHAPVRHSAKRRRIKTVMQELIYRAGRLIDSGRKLILGLGANDRAAKVFMQMHLELAGAA